MSGLKLNAVKKGLHTRECVLEVGLGKNVTSRDTNNPLEQLSQQ